MSTVNILVHGATGRLGSRVVALASEHGARVVACASRRAPLPESFDGRGDVRVVVDASSGEGAAAGAEIADRLGAALLVCSTGLSERTLAVLRSRAARGAVLVAPNTSAGVAAFHRALAELARALASGGGWEASMVEVHHTAKRDAPSGTALALARTLRAAGMPLDDGAIVSRREGQVVGEHTLTLSGPGETLTISHSALTRDVFAIGALRLARWLAGRAPGMYTVADAAGPGNAP